MFVPKSCKMLSSALANVDFLTFCDRFYLLKQERSALLVHLYISEKK